ncbi:M15 family metallopeptidase [Xanthomonas citri pv. glycines]|nr:MULTISPECIES: M15 family metallopeptidase [Xanthomonas]MCC8555693.1 M15 family metallopeptidase [Xanthomonas hortorum pv. gardneri]MCE4372642.1 M15 family metallopeptidase [Xanthomonas hortorum pv. hederae]WLA18025.1 M15 family metallopeptidase [Xanthomonas citri pv. glycines]
MVIFLLVASIACWLLLFPDVLERMKAWFGDRLRGLRQGAGRVRQRVGRSAGGVGERVRGGICGVTDFFRRHRWVILCATLLLLVPPSVILLVRQNVALEDFRSEDMNESSSMVAQLLRGERLVPPPPPPPEVFATEEIRRTRPEIVTADRRWENINADLQQRVLAIYEVMRRQYGYEMVLVEGYRSPERQAELMGDGRATRAGAWQSCHQYGLAVDSAPLRDGKLQWDMGDPLTKRVYFLYGELAQQAGLEWGGSWRSIKDYVHVEKLEACRRARDAKRAELTQG